MLRFKHRLALALGKSIVEINLLDVAEIRDWMAYHRFVEPIGSQSRWFVKLLMAWIKTTATEDELLGVEKIAMTGGQINAVLDRVWNKRR